MSKEAANFEEYNRVTDENRRLRVVGITLAAILWCMVVGQALLTSPWTRESSSSKEIPAPLQPLPVPPSPANGQVLRVHDGTVVWGTDPEDSRIIELERRMARNTVILIENARLIAELEKRLAPTPTPAPTAEPPRQYFNTGTSWISFPPWSGSGSTTLSVQVIECGP
jgi:hypothetical protein